MRITQILQAVDVIQAALPGPAEELDRVYNIVSMHCLDACMDGHEHELEKIREGVVERLDDEACADMIIKALGKEIKVQYADTNK